jgi:hypothetical protein
MPAMFAFVTPAAFYPIMLFVTAFVARHANLVPFCLKMGSASFLAIKMGCKSKYVHP